MLKRLSSGKKLSRKSLTIKYNVRVYDQLSCQRDTVSRYNGATQSDTVRNALPSN